MKIAFLLVGLACSTFALAQQNLSRQIKAIVKDSSNNFSSFKGDPKTGSDSVYHSTITLDGTYDNEILIFPETGWSYRAIIADSVNERKGKKIVEEWKDKLRDILGGSYNVKEMEIKPWNPARAGWKLSHRRQDVYVIMFPKPFKPSSFIVTLIFYP
jgi:hypothetical protein